MFLVLFSIRTSSANFFAWASDCFEMGFEVFLNDAAYLPQKKDFRKMYVMFCMSSDAKKRRKTLKTRVYCGVVAQKILTRKQNVLKGLYSVPWLNIK